MKYLSLILALFFVLSVSAQTKTSPDLAVSGLRLFDRASAKVMLDGYQARIGADGRPFYHFYNKYADQVIKLTGASMDDRFLIVEMEVYEVDESYKTAHFQNEKIATFKTDRGVFVGYRQTVASAIIGLPGVGGEDEIGVKSILKRFGEPAEKAGDPKNGAWTYRTAGLELKDDAGVTKKFDYEARYEFVKGKLKKFALKITE